MPTPRRHLVVTADDFGMGPATTRGILELAELGVVTSTLLLVNSPHAEQAMQQWRRSRSRLEVGWHPCLTLDRPILPPHHVSSLVDDEGRFLSLGRFMRRWLLGRIRVDEVRDEWQAQYTRYRNLIGRAPMAVATHHHVQVFKPLGAVLLDVLDGQRPLPFVRRVRESWWTLFGVPGARLKRSWLSWLGRGDARRQRQMSFPGNQWLLGITDPKYVADPRFMTRWLWRATGNLVELTCHPGHFDPTLVGRDCTPTDGMQERRVRELKLLRHPSFHEAVRAAGFQLVAPSEVVRMALGGKRHAA